MKKLFSTLSTKIIMAFVLIINLGVIGLSFTFAWFNQGINKIDTPIADGAILTNYFHCGTGESNDPYVITRPVHYYNFVMLYQKLTGFADKNAYFQIGYNIDGSADGSLEVYDYNDEGEIVSSTTYSSVLNMNYYTSLLPIGTSNIPFGGTFEGSNLTISNLHIVSQIDTNGTADLGIFGYVSASAVIKNCYFGNANLSLVSIDATNTSTNHTTHNTAYVGYIIGHLKSYNKNNINHLYVNNAKITGGNLAADGYGFIGYVEAGLENVESYINALESENPSTDYSFNLDAGDIHGFISSISGKLSNTMVTRNWGSSRYGGTLSSAITSNSSYYRLNGNSSSPSFWAKFFTTINYSFDTIGYYEETGETMGPYDVYYRNDDNERKYTALPTATVKDNLNDPNIQGTAGEYYYFDSIAGKWAYYKCTAPSTNTHAVTFTVPSQIFALNQATTFSHDVTATATLYIDGIPHPGTASAAMTQSNPNGRYNQITTQAINFGTFNLAEGTHYIGVVISLDYSFTIFGTRYIRCNYAYYGTANANTGSATGIAFNVTANSTKSMTLTNNGNSIITFNQIVVDPPSPHSTYEGPYYLYYIKDYAYVKYTEQNGVITNNNGVMQVTYANNNHFIADLYKNYIVDTTTQKKSGYDANNIDIVGQLDFYSTYISQGGYSSSNVTLSSDNFGTYFYGNKYCSSAFLLYIKNMPEVETLGTVKIYYNKASGSGSAQDLIIFKRTTSSSLSFYSGLSATYNSSATYEGTACNLLEATITPSTIANCAFCALDENGYIIAIPNGTNGLSYQTGKTSADISSYVLMMAVANDSYANIFDIDFNFKADAGTSDPEGLYMNTSLFTDIDYKDKAQTEITNSIMLLSFNAPTGAASNTFNISVRYTEDQTEFSDAPVVYNGIYIIDIIDTVDTSFILSILLSDNDDNPNNDYLYAYRIRYNGTYIQNVVSTYFQVSKKFTLSS